MCIIIRAEVVHIIMDIFIPTLCSTAADKASDVAGLPYGREGGGGRHTHTYARAYYKTSTATVGPRRNVLNLILYFFFFFIHFVLLFILL